MNTLAKSVMRALLPRRLYGGLRQARLAKSIHRFERREVTASFAGVNLRVIIGDTLAAAWYETGIAHLPEIECLPAHGLRLGATVFDLGAHQCVYALVLANTVGESGRVIAVEPNPHNVKMAEENKRLNAANRLTIVAAAVADFDGELEFDCALNGRIADTSSRESGFRVPTFSIDTLAKQYGFPSVVFVDLEGFEENALRGATLVMGRGATFLIETHVGCGLERFGGSVLRIASMLETNGYKLFMLSDEHPEPVTFVETDRTALSRFYLLASKYAGSA